MSTQETIFDVQQICSSLRLGQIQQRNDIRSSIGPFHLLPEYKIIYPKIVVDALSHIYAEYNEAFCTLVEQNKESETDYQYCMREQSPIPVNFGVQIDMVGLPQSLLEATSYMNIREVEALLRKRIFEIENSMAMYQLLEGIFRPASGDSFFKMEFRGALARLKRRFDRKPIALLAVTDQKYEAMRQSEFGKSGDEPLTDAEVTEMSGFDRFFGPVEFRDYIAAKKGKCEYLLYARTSDPVAKLKKPELVVDHPLLNDPVMRRVIKAHSVTINIDDPSWSVGDGRRINDTKAYMLPMGLAFGARSQLDVFTPGFAVHLSARKPYAEYEGDRFSRTFVSYLQEQGFSRQQIEAGEVGLRCKPMNGTYGCYGHVSGLLAESDFRNSLRNNLRKRGPYVIQPEMQVPTLVNRTDGQEYTYIDRNFLTTDGRNYRFMGGFRSLMPVHSIETRNGRNHGNAETVWAEINPSEV